MYDTVKVGAQIAKLEKKKKKAVQNENYDVAKQTKVCAALHCCTAFICLYLLFLFVVLTLIILLVLLYAGAIDKNRSTAYGSASKRSCSIKTTGVPLYLIIIVIIFVSITSPCSCMALHNCQPRFILVMLVS